MTDRRSKTNDKCLNLLTRLMLRSSASRRVDGLWIGSFDDKPEAGLNRVEEALNLIKTYDRLRYDRLVRDLERIWVILIPGGLASFDSSIWACKLDPRHVLDETKPLSWIAASIVHEATHARLWRCGIGYQEELRSRVETVCFGRERAFAAKLPKAEELVEQADRKLAAYTNQEYWSNEAFERRDDEGVRETLQYTGMPKWLIQMAMAVRPVMRWWRWSS